MLYTLTLLVMFGIGYALYATASRPAQVAPVQEFVQPMQTTETDTKPDTIVQALQLRLAALQQEVMEKDKKIAQLQRQPKTPSAVVRTITSPPANTASESEELKFLKWALSSQSGDVEKLRRENARLKAQVNDVQNK